MLDQLRHGLVAVERKAGGLAADLGLYALSAAFAGLTAATSTLAPHRAWGAISFFGYAAAALIVLVQLGVRRSLGGPAARGVLAGFAWMATTLVPLVVEAAQRAGGAPNRAQEEVVVVEHGGQRLLETGTPYLTRAAIAALPPDDRLLGYFPYQPGMALFGLPRAAWGVEWWTDARVAFAVVTAAALAAGLGLLHRAGAEGWALVRAGQAATVLPVCALTLAVGGDDLPVLALCLLALALAGRTPGRAQAEPVFGGGEPALSGPSWGSGLAVGAAGTLKLFAWPVAVVLLAFALARRSASRYAVPALGLPLAALVPAVVVDPGAAIENVVRFPLGRGLVRSPAQSPFPGQLIAAGLPAGRLVAAALLVIAALAVGLWLLRRPPHDAAAAAAVSAVGLLAAILLIPSTRFGYLLYPAALGLWVPALRVWVAPGPAGA